MSSTAATPSSFAQAARRVSRRVWLRRWVAWLSATAWLAAAVLAALALAGWVFHSQVPGLLAWGGFVGWLFVSLVYLRWRSPSDYSVLALWDKAQDRREAFASAWWFEQQGPGMTEAQRSHVEAQRQALPAAMPRLARDLPLRPGRWLWAPSAVTLAALLISARTLPVVEVVPLDDGMRELAKKEGKKLQETDWEKKKLEGLSAEEQKELDDLKEKLKKTAQDLQNGQGQDARQVMSDLERRAREAEKLAERMGADKDAWASESLVKSLREHADTADLGDAVAAKNAAQSAQAAEALAAQLKSPRLTNDTRERMNETLKDAAKQSEKEDRQRTVGQHVLSAGDHLKDAKAPEAGQEFQKLAEKMRDAARREQTRKELEKLAQQLRDAGSNIAGQNTGGMQQMAASGQQSQQQNQAGQQGQTPQVGQAQQGQTPQQGQGGQQSLQPPGLGQTGQGQQMQQSPVPGTGQQMMMAQQGQQGQQGNGPPVLMAPVPGQNPGEMPDAFMLGPPSQGPGDGPMMMLPGAAGLQAGVGKAELNADPTTAQKSANQAVVAAQQNNEGQSSVRSVEGAARKESASRGAAEIAVETIAAEEEALDESALPPSRREQVRRYFTELRKRFEKQ